MDKETRLEGLWTRVRAALRIQRWGLSSKSITMGVISPRPVISSSSMSYCLNSTPPRRPVPGGFNLPVPPAREFRTETPGGQQGEKDGGFGIGSDSQVTACGFSGYAAADAGFGQGNGGGLNAAGSSLRFLRRRRSLALSEATPQKPVHGRVFRTGRGLDFPPDAAIL